MLYHNTQKGIILLDILMALSLSAFFISILAESSMTARDIFRRAYERNELLDTYEAHASEVNGLLPHGTYSVHDLNAATRWYGNDRIETDIYVTSTTSAQTVSFTKITSYPFAYISDTAGTPLCSVDMFQKQSHLSIAPLLLPISSSISLTHIEVRNNVAYVSADSSNVSDPDMFVVDIQDPVHPSLLSSIHTGPGISSFSLAGNRVFAAAASTAAQLHIIRFDSLRSPILEKKYQVPLPYATATPPVGSSIFFNKNTIYLGTDKWDGDEFFMVDVSDPIHPRIRSSLAIDTKINDIVARDSHAYIAASGEQQLIDVNVEDPSRPYIMRFFNPSGWLRQEGKVISSFEDGLHVGRTSGGFNIIQDRELFSWASTTTTPSDFDAPQSVDMPGGVYGVIADRNHVYVATRQVGKEFQVFDMSLATSTASYYPLPVLPQSMTCDGDVIYILGKGSPVVYEISAAQSI